MQNLYATPDDIQAHNAGTVAMTDAALMQVIEMVSRQIDDYCGRHFYTTVGTKLYEGRGMCSLALPDDLLAITALATDHNDDFVYEQSWAETDYLLHPANAWPKWKIYVTPDSDMYFPNSRPEGPTVSITGVWGYGDGLSATPWATTSVTGTVATANGTSLTLAGNGPIVAGQTIKIGDEQMFVSAVTAGATGPATVERGVNGTTAVAHTGEAITIAKYPPAIVLYTIWRAGQALHELASAGYSSETIADYTYRLSTAVEVDAMERRGLGSYMRIPV